MKVDHYRSPDKSYHCIHYKTYEGVVCSKHYKSKDSALKSKRAVIKAVTWDQRIFFDYKDNVTTLKIKSPNGIVVLQYAFKNKDQAEAFLNELRSWVSAYYNTPKN